jgi:hypothetical protein
MKAPMIEIAKRSNEYTLYWRAENAEWVSLKLIAGCDRPKQNWYLGWNGVRLARDALLLQEHLPEIFEWVVSVLAGRERQP